MRNKIKITLREDATEDRIQDFKDLLQSLASGVWIHAYADFLSDYKDVIENIDFEDCTKRYKAQIPNSHH